MVKPKIANPRIFCRNFSVLIFSVLLTNCEEYPEVISPWPPEDISISDPVIAFVSPPADSAFANYSIITLTGSNFSSDSAGNIVYFNSLPVDIISQENSPLFGSKVTLKAPNLPSDDITIKLVSKGAMKFATYPYKLKAVGEEYGGFTNIDKVRAIAMDSGENLFAQLSDKSVVKVTPDGLRIDYGTVSFSQAGEIRIGPGGFLYIQRISQRTFWRIPPGGGEAELFLEFPEKVEEKTVKMHTFDFDANGMIYCGGSSGGLFVVGPDTLVNSTEKYLSDKIISIRVYSDYVYVATLNDIWKNEILSSDGSLGDREKVFDWSDAGPYSKSNIKSITFNENGEMIIGTVASGKLDPVLRVNSNGKLVPVYEGVLLSPAIQVLWGNDIYMYVNRYTSDNENRRIIKVNMLQLGSAYHGRGL